MISRDKVEIEAQGIIFKLETTGLDSESSDRITNLVVKVYDSIGSCAECKYYQGEEVVFHYCSEYELWVREGFFCKYLKRKENV